MLSNLYIENIAVIEKTNIDFTEGLNILTGETGAGKSIIIDAISAVLGRRTSRELVRTGAESAFVSARFVDVGTAVKETLGSLGYSLEDGELLIEREFTLSGRNNCRINGRPASVTALKDIGKYLINIHGQHESYELMSPDLHIGYIDALGGLSDDIEAYREEYHNLQRLTKILNQKDSDDRDRARRADLLRFQIEELECAEIEVGEYSALTAERNILRNASKLRELLSFSSFALTGDGGEVEGVLSHLSDSADNAEQAADLMPQLCSLSERLRSVYYELEDISSDISSYADSLEDDPARLEEIETRLDFLSKLMKKYGDTEEEILGFLDSIKSELETIESFEENREALAVQRRESLERAASLASVLTAKRKETSAYFAKEVTERMHRLDMPSAKVEVSIKECALNENGADEIEFLVSANAGEPVKPVAKVASGGELSRMMLAVKTVLSESDPTDTLIFDEVDSGISGSAAGRVGQALKEVSLSTQSICVTHLPQIASLATTHFLISKHEENGRTFTNVTMLDEKGRIDELARIIGGTEIADSAYDYAKELLAKQNKVQ